MVSIKDNKKSKIVLKNCKHTYAHTAIVKQVICEILN